MSFKYGSIDTSQVFGFQNMQHDQLTATPEYKSILEYLVSATGLTPAEVTHLVGFVTGAYLDHQFIFTDAKGNSFSASVTLAMLNPMVLVLELQKAGLIPAAPIPAFKQPTAASEDPWTSSAPPPHTALGSVANSFGDLIPGFDPPRRALLAPFQGHVAIGTHCTREDGTWTLTAVFMNPTGVWMQTAPATLG